MRNGKVIPEEKCELIFTSIDTLYQDIIRNPGQSEEYARLERVDREARSDS